jgi:hypothetical protein
LKLEKHPDKAAMGRIKKGTYFLGFYFSLEGYLAADKTIEIFIEHTIRIFEHKQREPPGSLLLRLYV